jgi:hypothetical protein
MELSLKVVGIISSVNTVIIILILIWRFLHWIRGISPVLFRLGKGLAHKKIAVFAGSEHLTSIINMLSDSGIFPNKNVISVSDKSEISRAETASLYLVHWKSFEEHIDAILTMKKDKVGLVVFAPQGEGPISGEKMGVLSNTRNTSVTNFRGRLLSDILVSMMTTGYSHK